MPVQTTITVICDRCQTRVTNEINFPTLPLGWVNLTVFSSNPARDYYFCSVCWPFVRTVSESPGLFVWDTTDLQPQG